MIKKYFQTNGNTNFSMAIVWIKGGSSEDLEGKKGLNHILCSLLSRGCKDFENLEFSEFIDSHGAELNLETLEDGMLISLKSLNNHFSKLFPLVELMINKPLLLESQFQNVKKSTIDCLKKDKENPFNITFEKWRKLVYIKHPYAYNSSGYEEDISKITHNDILSEFEKFKNRNMYLISNNIEINNMNFELFSNNNREKISLSNHFQLNPNRYVSTHQKSNQIIFMIGNQTCSQTCNEHLPLKVLESHLSYGMSSILFKLFREKNGLTYEAGVFNPSRKHNSPFLIYLSVTNKNALLAFEILSEFWKKLLSTLIPEKELNLAKEKLKSSFLMSRQTLDEILQRKIQLIGNEIDPNFDIESFNKIENINSEDILKITNKYLSKPFLSIYGDEKICNEINKLWVKNF